MAVNELLKHRKNRTINASLGRIRADGPPTDYFPKHEFEEIIDATYLYQPKGWVECRNQAKRLRILTLLMRWSGLAIRDAVTLERGRLNDGNVLLVAAFDARAARRSQVQVKSDNHACGETLLIPNESHPVPFRRSYALSFD